MPFRHCICFRLDRFIRSGSGHFKQITRDSNNSASTSTALIETVNKYPTNTVLTVTPNAETVGQTITLKADVSSCNGLV